MSIPIGLKSTLLAASAVELFAGSSLALTPRRFIQRTYGVRGAVDPLTVKFARCVYNAHLGASPTCQLLYCAAFAMRVSY